MHPVFWKQSVLGDANICTGQQQVDCRPMPAFIHSHVCNHHPKVRGSVPYKVLCCSSERIGGNPDETSKGFSLDTHKEQHQLNQHGLPAKFCFCQFHNINSNVQTALLLHWQMHSVYTQSQDVLTVSTNRQTYTVEAFLSVL